MPRAVRWTCPTCAASGCPGRSSVELDLATITPRRTELGLHVLVSRGRLSSTVRDTVDRLGTGPLATDWIAPQAGPVTSGTLLGLPRGDGHPPAHAGQRR